MAWTAPRTWADGDIVTPEMLNTDIRDNLLAVSTHSHDGTAGAGADELAGLDTVTLDDGAEPAAPGASKTIVFAESGKLKQRAGASGSTEELSVTGHQHSILNDATPSNAATSGALTMSHTDGLTTGALAFIHEVTMASLNLTGSAAGVRAWGHAFFMFEMTAHVAGSGGPGNTYAQLRINGAIVDSQSWSNGSLSVGFKVIGSLEGERDVGAGSKAFQMVIDRNSEGSSSHTYKGYANVGGGIMKSITA